jgi:hypothetical protein
MRRSSSGSIRLTTDIYKVTCPPRELSVPLRLFLKNGRRETRCTRGIQVVRVSSQRRRRANVLVLLSAFGLHFIHASLYAQDSPFCQWVDDVATQVLHEPTDPVLGDIRSFRQGRKEESKWGDGTSTCTWQRVGSHGGEQYIRFYTA